MQSDTRITVSAAIAEGAKLDSVEAIKDIIELDRLAAEKVNAPAMVKLRAMNFPVIVGNLEFRKPSLGALFWVVQFTAWHGEDGLLCDAALWYTETHRTLEIQALYEPVRAKQAVETWAKTITTITQDQMEAASREVMGSSRRISADYILGMAKQVAGQPGATAKGVADIITMLSNAGTKNSEGNDLSDTLVMVMRLFPGLTAEYWTWEKSSDDVIALLNAVSRSENKANAETAKATLEAWQDEAGSRFAAAARAFRMKWCPPPVETAKPDAPVAKPPSNETP